MQRAPLPGNHVTDCTLYMLRIAGKTWSDYNWGYKYLCQYIQRGGTYSCIKRGFILVNCNGFSCFQVPSIGTAYNGEVFIAYGMPRVKEMIINVAVYPAHWSSSTRGDPPMFGNTGTIMTNRFANIWGIAHSTLVFVHNIATNRGGNPILVRKHATYCPFIFKYKPYIHMGEKIR